MQIDAIKVETVKPPKDDLLAKIRASALTLEDGDVVALASKVVAIHQGRCVPYDRAQKDELIKQEAELYLERDEVPGGWVMHTIKNGTFMPSAGIDPLGGYYVLWPERPKETADELLEWFKKEYQVSKLGLVITDSRSVFLRRGVVGVALAWAGFEPLYENQPSPDLLGHPSAGSKVNVADALAAAAVFVMGEGNEGTPLVRLRDVPYVHSDKTSTLSYELSVDEDIHAPFLKQNWKQGGTTSS